jgi:site-specific DNA-methyltransferase (adenine-specific)/modification methylase
MLDINKVFLGDCFNIFPKLEDNQIDHVFTSPPYNRKRNDKYDEYNDNIEDYFLFLCNVIDECMRISKGYVFFNIQKNFYNKIDVYKLFGKYSNMILDVFIWEKTNPLPASGKAITNAYEFIIVFSTKLKLKSNYTYTKNHLTTSVSSPIEGHRAVMHINTAYFFIKNFTQKKEIIFDPFMGVGTTAIVSKALNRNYMGCEKTKKYYDICLKRIEDYQYIFSKETTLEASQLKLF